MLSDVQRIQTAQMISTMQLPDILADWDKIEQEVRAKVDKEIAAKSQIAKQTLARYKDYVENHYIARKIESIDWNSSQIYAYDSKPECDIECINFCFSAEKFFSEDVKGVYDLCLVAHCNCTTEEVEYDVSETVYKIPGQRSYGSDQDFYDKNGLLIY